MAVDQVSAQERTDPMVYRAHRRSKQTCSKNLDRRRCAQAGDCPLAVRRTRPGATGRDAQREHDIKGEAVNQQFRRSFGWRWAGRMCGCRNPSQIWSRQSAVVKLSPILLARSSMHAAEWQAIAELPDIR